MGPVSLLRFGVLLCSPRFLLFRRELASWRLVYAREHVSVATDGRVIAHELLALSVLGLLVRILRLVWLLLLVLPRQVARQSSLRGHGGLRGMLLVLCGLHGGRADLPTLHLVVEVARARGSTLEGVFGDDLL